jgi:hypothetical protein
MVSESVRQKMVSHSTDNANDVLGFSIAKVLFVLLAPDL